MSRVGEVAEEHHLVALLTDVELAVEPDAVGDGAGRRRRTAPASVVGRRLGQRFAVDDVEGGVEQQQVAGAAGVDDTGVGAAPAAGRRAGERRPAGVARRTEHAGQRLAGGGRRGGRPSALSRTTVRIVPSIGLSTAW